MDENLKREFAIESFKFELDYASIKCIVIVGKRGTGKTQLAYYLMEEFKKVGITTYIVEEQPLVYTRKQAENIIRRMSDDILIFVSQAISFLDLNVLDYAPDLVINADIVKFDRSLGYYGPDS